MSSIKDEMQAVKDKAKKDLRELRDRERREQQAVNERIVVLLQRHAPEKHEAFSAAARSELEAERRQRSERARRSKKAGAPHRGTGETTAEVSAGPDGRMYGADGSR